MFSKQPDDGQGHSSVALWGAYIRHLIDESSDGVSGFGVGGGPPRPSLDIFDVGDRLIQVVAHVATKSAFRTIRVSSNAR